MARQGGVHISYLIVAIVICLGLVFFIVAQNGSIQQEVDAKNTAVSNLDKKTAELRKATDELFQARKILTGDETGTPDYEAFEKFLEDAREEWSKVASVSNTSFQSMDEFSQVAYDTTKHWRREFDAQKALAAGKDADYRAEMKSKESIVDAKMAEIEGQKSKVEGLQTQLESAEAEGREKVSRLQDELDSTIDDYTTQIQNKERELWVEKNRLAQARQRIEHLEREILKEKKFADAKPDGQVIQVADELGFAWINIGRKQRLRSGLVFDVFNYVKGGKKLRKGQIEIMKIEEDIAKARVTGTLDSFNPISEGDFVSSPFYNKDDVPIFVFAGDKLSSQRISLEELGRKIGEYGGKVEDDVRIETTFVVAIDGYDATPEYATARRLGITIVGERELLNFVGY